MVGKIDNKSKHALIMICLEGYSTINIFNRFLYAHTLLDQTSPIVYSYEHYVKEMWQIMLLCRINQKILPALLKIFNNNKQFLEQPITISYEEFVKEIQHNDIIRILLYWFKTRFLNISTLAEKPLMQHYLLVNKIIGLLERKGKSVLTERLLRDTIKFAKKSFASYNVRTDSSTLFSAGSDILSTSVTVKSTEDSKHFKVFGITHKHNANLVVRTVIALIKEPKSERFYYERLYRCFKDTADRTSNVPSAYNTILDTYRSSYIRFVSKPLGERSGTH